MMIRSFTAFSGPFLIGLFVLGATLTVGLMAGLITIPCANAAEDDVEVTDSSSKPAIAPIDEVRQTITKVVDTVQKFSGDSNKVVRRDKLREIINPVFDFSEMAKRSLGAHWKTATATERDEFVSVFSDLLARTYLARIETVQPNMVSIDSEAVNHPKASVKTTVTNKGETFPIEYKLLAKGSAWAVYDVVIENIGLVGNYRNEFSGIIRKEEIAGLIRRLKEKNRAAES